MQGLLVLLREELDTGDPVEVFGVQGELGLALQVPLGDAVVASNGDDVFL